GQRAMLRRGFLTLTSAQRARYGVETLINRQARAQGWRVAHVVMQGVSHPVKERKIGPVRGLISRFHMYGEIFRTLADSRGPSAEAELTPDRVRVTEYRESGPVEEGGMPR